MLFAKLTGQANKDFAVPNTIETAFNLGSMNKMFTAVAIAQLVEQGRLSYDDPLARFLPDFLGGGRRANPNQAPVELHGGPGQLFH